MLDAGCGLGYGLDILAKTARSVQGQDVDSRLAGPAVRIAALEEFADASVDSVVSVDVIEHVERDHEFLAQLVRISRRQVILTTPNWTAGRCTWPYHVREYTPRELRALGSRFGPCELWKGTPDGREVYPIVHPALNDLLNSARVARGVAGLTRGYNAILPRPSKIHSHLAIRIHTTATNA